ncbi:MAG TPA: phosphatase PAP2 family protein [Thermoanaerobaculia bacterium]|nr:phosphatase PAP2 family protein [Thermoanaerobaculia bacterium]
MKLVCRLGLAPLEMLLLLAAGPGLAQTTDSPLVAELHRYLNDGASIATASSRFDVGDWADAAAIYGGVAFVGARDDRIDAWVQSHRSKQTEDFARVVKPFGTWAAIGVSALALGDGLVSHNERFLDTGRDAVEAEILAAGITTPLLKYAVGRVRPSGGADADEFKSFSGNSSFPSGETTEAFAVASVLSARAEGWVVPVVSYTLASCVGYARVHDRGHWTSDVIAGGLVGTLIGRTVVKRHRRDETQPEAPSAAYSFRIAPVVSAGSLGFTARTSF